MERRYKNNPSDKVTWIEDTEQIGIYKFTFDGTDKVFYLFGDYPDKLTKEQRHIFDQENPQWRDFFRK